jgi:hypothetical protein
MAQPPSIPSGTCSATDIAPYEILNTPMQDTQLQRRVHSPHQEAADMVTKNMHYDEKLRIVRKSTAKTNMQKHAVGCMLLNHIK